MKIALRPNFFSGFIFLVFLSCSTDVPGRIRAFPKLNDSLSLEQSCRMVSSHLASIDGTSSDSSAYVSFYHVLDSTGRALRTSLGDNTASRIAADSIIKIVFTTWGIGFDSRDTVLETLLPHLVYKNRKGACLGVSLIILMLAEKTGCPVFGVMLPGHFFCRFDNGKTRFNIEPNKGGMDHPDGYYREKYLLGQRPWYTMHDLSRRETAGMLCYNAGLLCLHYRKNSEAVAYFKRAMAALNGLPEAQGNCALAFAQNGDMDSSLALFRDLFASHPDFVNCAANYGSVLLAVKKYRTAQMVFQKGLEFFPDDTVLRRGLEAAKGHSGIQGAGADDRIY
jgi:hypothetical protein